MRCRSRSLSPDCLQCYEQPAQALYSDPMADEETNAGLVVESQAHVCFGLAVSDGAARGRPVAAWPLLLDQGGGVALGAVRGAKTAEARIRRASSG
jgi:hypothetical protein